MAFFSSAIDTLQTLVIALGAGLGVWQAMICEMDCESLVAAWRAQGMKQLMAGGGVVLIGTTLIPLLSGLFG